MPHFENSAASDSRRLHRLISTVATL